MAYIPANNEEAAFLKNYDSSKYQKPAVAADTALFAVDGSLLKILLIQRGGFPYKGCWALPGGFVDIDEDIRTGAQRELAEETGIRGIYIEQAFTWGRPDRDPRGRVITVSYIALADFSQISPQAGDDAAAAEWFTIEDHSKTSGNGMTRIAYRLRGPELLAPVVSYPTDRPQEIEAKISGGLAFDHAESIAYSFALLRHRIQHGSFLDFALPSAQQKSRARQVISNL